MNEPSPKHPLPIADLKQVVISSSADGRNSGLPREEPLPEEASSKQSTQYGLSGLLWFVLVCSAYFSLIAVFRSIVIEKHPITTGSLFAVYFAWGVIFVYYSAKRVRGMLVAHCTGPIMAELIALSEFSRGQFGILGNMQCSTFMAFLIYLAVGCWISSLLSFPFTVIRLIVYGLWYRYFKSGEKAA
ncbi:MAG: hypothetical protein JXB10_18950 [Pirellulales bacterium]|nr:hypothetical protein [Pirellulales bacterium]